MLTKNLTVMMACICCLACCTKVQNKPVSSEYRASWTPNELVRIGIDGLSHDHISGVLRNIERRQEIQLVGIAESNKELVDRIVRQFGIDRSIIYDNLTEMIEQTKPHAVLAFNSIYDHLKTVEICAPRGIHVMVEKPLAVNMKHALQMQKLAEANRIHLLTNYETTWYPTHYRAFDIVADEAVFGSINKVLINDGHRGPVEIGCSKEFLAWLTDPVQNGGGAVIDFGCYGANLMTWLMHNQRPQTVTAVLQTIKPDVYPKVDDQATIVVTYPTAQAIIQGSWNWPIDRKDLEIFGRYGRVKAINTNELEYQPKNREPSVTTRITEFPFDTRDPYIYFARIIKGEIELKPTDLASLENNMIVVEILDAARQSAQQGKTIRLAKLN